MPKRALVEIDDQQREIAARLAEARKMACDNQGQVADSLGVSKSTWNRYETGERSLNVYVLARFCRRYQVSADLILVGSKRRV